MIKNGMIGAACFVLGIAACGLAQTTADMERAAGDSLKKADTELNQIYKALRDTLTDDEKERLKEVQKLWISYRDKEAEFAASLYEGGTLSGVVKINTTTASTESRIAALKSLFREGYREGH